MKDAAEGRMGALRATEAKRNVEKQKYASNPMAYQSAEGDRFLDAINWRGMQEMFEALARRIDPEREKEAHIAERDDVYFVKGQLALQRPPLRIIELDFDGIRARARKFNDPVFEDLYALKILLHEEAHIAAGGKGGRVLSSKGQGWLGEGLDELIAQNLMPEYVRRYGYKNYTAEDVQKFVQSDMVQGDLPSYQMAGAFIEGVIAIFARDFATPPDNREQVFNGLMRAHFRDANLLRKEYRKVFTAVLGEDKMPEIAAAPRGRALLRLLTESETAMARLRQIDAPLAERLKVLADSPLTEKEIEEANSS